MDINKITRKLQKKCDRIQAQMRAKARIKTGWLRNSIILKVIGSKIYFYTPQLTHYAKYQDEGIWAGRRTTKESRRAWGTTQYRNNTHRGFTGTHFTDPMKQLSKEEIIKEIKPEIIEAMKLDIQKIIKRT